MTTKSEVESEAATDTKLVAYPEGFLDKASLLRRVPFSTGTLQNRMKDGSIPFIRLGGRRVLFHWPSVEAALLRQQRGGE